MKISIHIEIEDSEGEPIERLIRAIESMGKPIELPKPPERFMSGDPKDFHFQPIRRRNGHG